MLNSPNKLPHFSSRLMLLEALLAVILLGWYTVHVFFINKDTIRDEFQDISMTIDSSITEAFNNAQSILLYISSTLKDTEHFEQSKIVAALRSAKRQQEVRSFFSWSAIFWSSADFLIKVHSSLGVLPPPYKDVSMLDYLPRTVIMPETLQMGVPIMDYENKKWVLPVGLGVTAGSNEYVGTLHAVFEIEKFVDNLRDHLGINQDVSFLLFDRNGTTIAESEDHFISQRFINMTKEYLHTFDGRPRFKFAPLSFWREDKSFYITHLEKSGYYLCMIMHEKLLKNALIASVQRTFYDLSLMISLSVVIFLFVRRFVVMPMINLSKVAEKIASNQFREVIIGEHDTIETALLADSLRQEAIQKVKLQDINSRMKFLINNLEVVDQMKHDFMRNIQHELRTPLNHIIGGCSLLLTTEAAHGVTAELSEYLQMISKAAQELLEKINNIILVSDLESSTVKLSESVVRLKPLIEDAISPLLPLIQQNQLKLSIKIPPKLPKIKIDKEKVQLALFNLFNNSIKFNIPGGDISVKATHTVGGILLIIKNTGSAIPELKLNNITQMFSIGDSMLSKIKGGLGLGLAITQNIFKLHDVKMNISNSHSSEGVEVQILIPNIRIVEIIE